MRTQIELASALRRERKLEAENELLRGTMPNLIAESPAMRPVIEMISRVAPSDANVLITGENGTGKSLIARAIHALSPARTAPMITVNMGGLSETLFESELFGHVKGAFTDAKTDRAGRFELADESTLFMDEIANIPLAQQAKLLRVIETGDFERVGSSKTLHANVRIISATNANLDERSGSRSFSAGPPVSSEYYPDYVAAFARPARGHHAACQQFSCVNTPSAIGNRLPVSMRQRESVCCNIPFREMFASSIMSSNAPCL